MPAAASVRPRRRPRGLVHAIALLREARRELIAVYRVTEAAELQAMLARLERADGSES